jgi:hypothetical protein
VEKWVVGGESESELTSESHSCTPLFLPDHESASTSFLSCLVQGVPRVKCSDSARWGCPSCSSPSPNQISVHGLFAQSGSKTHADQPIKAHHLRGHTPRVAMLTEATRRQGGSNRGPMMTAECNRNSGNDMTNSPGDLCRDEFIHSASRCAVAGVAVSSSGVRSIAKVVLCNYYSSTTKCSTITTLRLNALCSTIKVSTTVDC